MDQKRDDEFFELLRPRGLRKKLAKSIAGLEGNSRRNGAQGRKSLARQSTTWVVPRTTFAPGSSEATPSALLRRKRPRAGTRSKRRSARHRARSEVHKPAPRSGRTRAKAKAGSRS